jgi:hypothetical protein
VNEEKPPPITILEHNPLLYTRIEEVDPIVTDSESGILSMITNAKPQDAIACILFSRFLGHMNHFMLGVTETASPSISSIGVAEIIGAGIEKIIRSLAIYLFLYHPRDELAADEMLSTIHPQLLSDVASVCLLPEVLSSVVKLPGHKLSAEMFWNREAMCYILKQIIDTHVSKLAEGTQ